MNEIEKKLFKKLCSFLTVNSEDLEKYISHATPNVLGMLFFNRMSAIAYYSLKKNSLLEKVNREFRTSLRSAYEANIKKNISFINSISYISDLLKGKEGTYAMLKGAVLCEKYPEGCRSSNDIDLLVYPDKVTEIGEELKNNGFEQGYIRNDDFVPATRKEIIESKMMRGETVPYIKRVALEGMKYLEVDLNFSLDYKNGSPEALEKMLENVIEVSINNRKMQVLYDDDFFIHLCGHLYKEATTLPWVEMRRDMTLYKYCDIYMLLHEMTREKLHAMFCRAMELNMLDICCFAILQTSELFEKVNPIAISMAKSYISTNSNILHQVISPVDKKIYIYSNSSVSDRFFNWNRKYLLQEDHYDKT